MKKVILSCLLFLNMTMAFAQKFTWENKKFEAVNTKVEIIIMDGVQVLKVQRNTIAFPFDKKNIETSTDSQTFVKLTDVAIENGTIEVKILSRIIESSSFPTARGFVVVGCRIEQKIKISKPYIFLQVMAEQKIK